MEKKVVCYSPYKNIENKYIDISKKAIAENGYLVLPINLKNILKCKVVFLNWEEKLPKNKLVFAYLKKRIKLFLFSILRRKYIITFHNRKPHDSTDNSLQKKIIKKYYKKAYKIIVLSKDSKKYLSEIDNDYDFENKIYYIPHPNYINVYSSNKIKERTNHNILNLMFFGMIKPYKNIELLIKLASEFQNEPIVFKIVGNCTDEKYKTHITDLCGKYNNIDLECRFIEDDEIADFMYLCDALILPYNISSSMNSGTIILAFSYKKTVICPNISTIKDFDKSNIYFYDYINNNDHYQKLKTSVEIILNDFKKDKTIIYDKGINLYDEVSKNNSYELVKGKYQKLLEALENEK